MTRSFPSSTGNANSADRTNSTVNWQIGDSDIPTLSQLISAFETARDSADWLSISQLNDYTQPCVEAEIVALQASAKARGNNPAEATIALKPQLETLSSIYQFVQQQCIAERDSLAVKLGQVNVGRAGTQQYVSNSSL